MSHSFSYSLHKITGCAEFLPQFISEKLAEKPDSLKVLVALKLLEFRSRLGLHFVDTIDDIDDPESLARSLGVWICDGIPNDPQLWPVYFTLIIDLERAICSAFDLRSRAVTLFECDEFMRPFQNDLTNN